METGGRLDRVWVLAAQREVELPWASRDMMLDLMRPLASAAAAGIVHAFEDVGATRPVALNLHDKELLLELLETWTRGVDNDEMPPGIWELRCALIDDLHGLR